MPIQNYSVLKGDPQRGEVAGRNPHYRIFLQAGSQNAQVDVNIESMDGSEVRYVIYDPFTPPLLDALTALPMGQTPLDSVAGGLAIDFVREQEGVRFLVNQADMSLLPIATSTNDLKNAVVAMLNAAVADPDGAIYAFGSFYSDPGGTLGIHDIHMNQGNPLNSHGEDNGTWQDGALYVNLPATNKWIGLFIAFQTQSWRTDDSGNPV